MFRNTCLTFSLLVCICVCINTWVCVGRCMDVCGYSETGGQCWVSLFIIVHLTFLSKGLSLSLELVGYTNLDVQQGPGILLFPSHSSGIIGVYCIQLWCGTVDPNSGPHAYREDFLPTESSPLLFFFSSISLFFLKKKSGSIYLLAC